MKNKKLNHQSQKGVGLVEVALGLSLAMIGIMAVIHLDGLKNKYLKANRESGELRDLRAYLQRKVSCPNTISDPACTTTANSQISAKSCNSQNITSSVAPSKIGNFEVKVSCGTDYGSDRMFVEYRPSQTNTANAWKDLNRGIPWTCSAGGEEGYNWSDLKISSEFMCGLSNGDVYCWGQNFMGVLGDPSKGIVLPNPVGANGQSTSQIRNDCPVKVEGLQNPVSKIVTTGSSACAFEASNVWKCWGAVEPIYGLPIATPSNSSVSDALEMENFVSKSPRTTILNINLDSLFMGETSLAHSICVPDPLGVQCYYSLKNPVRVDDIKIHLSPPGIAQKISGNGDSGCALHFGGVSCWEKALNTNPPFPTTGQYEDVWMWPVTPMIPIGPNQGKNIVDIYGNKKSGCAKSAANEIWCWGDYNKGQRGIGHSGDVNPNQATLVTNLSSGNIKDFHLPAHNNRCLLQDGAVKCWGANPTVMPDLTQEDLKIPTIIPGFESNIKKLYCGGAKCCAVDQNQEIRCFGSGSGLVVDPTLSSTTRFRDKKLLEMCPNKVWKINPSATGGGTSSCTP